MKAEGGRGNVGSARPFLCSLRGETYPGSLGVPIVNRTCRRRSCTQGSDDTYVGFVFLFVFLFFFTTHQRCLQSDFFSFKSLYLDLKVNVYPSGRSKKKAGMLVMANRRLPPLLIYNPHVFMPNASWLSKSFLSLHALCRHPYCTCMPFVLFSCIKLVNKEIFLPSSCCQAMHIF